MQRHGDQGVGKYGLISQNMVDRIVKQNAYACSARQTEPGKRFAPLDDAVVEFQITQRLPSVGRTVKLLQGNFAARERGSQGNELIKRGALLQSCKTLRGIVNGSLIRHLQFKLSKAVPYLTEHDARNFSAELVGGDKPFFVDFERSYSLKSPVER